MAYVHRLRWRVFAVTVILGLAASSCGGSSTDPVVAPIGGDNVTTAPTNEDSSATVDQSAPLPPNAIPGYDARICVEPTTCPEEIRPNTWIGIEPGSATTEAILPIGGSRVITSSSDQLRLWDVDNVLNGETVIVTPPAGVFFRNHAPQLLPDGRVAIMHVSGLVTENPVVIYDLQADNPGEPDVVFDANASSFVVLADGQVATLSEDDISIWDPASPNEPIQILPYRQDIGLSQFGGVAAAPNGGIFWQRSTTSDGGLWQWSPPAEPTRVTEYAPLGAINTRDLITVLADRYVLVPRRIGAISLLDLETNEVTIVNVPVETPDDRLDFINTVVTADGKVLASSDGFGDVYLWDLDRPEEPTVIFEGIDGAIVRGDELVEPRVHAIAVLDDGRSVIATPVVNAAGDDVITQYEILSDL